MKIMGGVIPHDPPMLMYDYCTDDGHDYKLDFQEL